MDPTHQTVSFMGVREQRITSWHNPTEHLQRVVIDDGNGQKFLFSVSPGETRELDSRFDRAIHIVDCGRDECHKRGWFCHAGHEGTVLGGGAPLLKRLGKDDKLDSAVDPAAAARKEAEESVRKEVERTKLMAEAYARENANAEARTNDKPAQAPSLPVQFTPPQHATPAQPKK